MKYFFILFFFTQFTHAEVFYFNCMYGGNPYTSTPSNNRSFDRVFSFKMNEDGSVDNFLITKGSVGGSIISKASLDYSGKRQGFLREVYDVYRMDLGNNKLIHSYVYYITPEDFKKNFSKSKNPYSIRNYVNIRDQKSLFNLVRNPLPAGYIKIGYDKSQWDCEKVSYIKYQWHSFVKDLTSVLSAG